MLAGDPVAERNVCPACECDVGLLLSQHAHLRTVRDMKVIETFAPSERISPVSRRRLLQVVAASVAAPCLVGLGSGVSVPSHASAARQAPPPYDDIVGLL